MKLEINIVNLLSYMISSNKKTMKNKLFREYFTIEILYIDPIPTHHNQIK